MRYLVDAANPLIAATALVCDLIIVTRSDFEKAGLEIVDPFTT